MKQKATYLLESTTKILRGKSFLSCPSCGYKESTVVDRKYIVTTLRRCKKCQLLYRAPITTSQENEKFYQHEYNQDFTTQMPSQEVLNDYLKIGFKGTEKDFSSYIDILKALDVKPKSKIFDFGCSWGYGSWQIAKSGFEVEAFEISTPRASYARKQLGITVYSDTSKVKGFFDVFFSSHVLEHVPSVQQAIDFAFKILKPGGLFIAFTPNGSQSFRNKEPVSWQKLWGNVHPNFLDNTYYSNVFTNKPFLLTSNPYDIQEIKKWSNGTNQQSVLNLEGDELLVIVRK